MTRKKDKLSELEIAETFEVVKGFNITVDDEDVRVDPGTDKPLFVKKDDYPEEVWEKLIKLGAVRLYDDPTRLKEGETVAAEIIED